MSDLAHLGAETVLEPLRDDVAMAPLAAVMAIGSRFPAEHHWKLTKVQQAVTDGQRIETVEDFAVKRQVAPRRYRLEPRSGFEFAYPVVAGHPAWNTPADPDWGGTRRKLGNPGSGHDQRHFRKIPKIIVLTGADVNKKSCDFNGLLWGVGPRSLQSVRLIT
jgi:hypothetical protein